MGDHCDSLTRFTYLTETPVRQALAIELQRAEVWVLIVVRIANWVQLKITAVFSFRDWMRRQINWEISLVEATVNDDIV